MSITNVFLDIPMYFDCIKDHVWGPLVGRDVAPWGFECCALVAPWGLNVSEKLLSVWHKATPPRI